MSKKYTKGQMTKMLTELSGALASQTDKFPGVASVVIALSAAAVDPTKAPEGIRVPTAQGATKTTKKAVKPVSIAYEDKTIVVSNVVFGAAHYAMNRINGKAKEGSKHHAPGKDWHESQVYSTCRNKKRKSYILPLAKAAAVLAWFKDAGIKVVQAAAA